jgi:hypothetical protein
MVIVASEIRETQSNNDNMQRYIGGNIIVRNDYNKVGVC